MGNFVVPMFLLKSVTYRRCQPYKCTDKTVKLESWWNENTREKAKSRNKNLSQCHFVHLKSDIEWARVKPSEKPRLTCWVQNRQLYYYHYTGCHRRKGPNFGRVFLMLNYSDITQNTYVQSWTVSEIMASKVSYFNSCYTLIDYQIHIETGRNMWFL